MESIRSIITMGKKNGRDTQKEWRMEMKELKCAGEMRKCARYMYKSINDRLR